MERLNYSDLDFVKNFSNLFCLITSVFPSFKISLKSDFSNFKDFRSDISFPSICANSNLTLSCIAKGVWREKIKDLYQASGTSC